MTPEQYLLASAYLDGELTDDERRLVEADPAVMAEVEGLRALHVELTDVEPPTAAARESAIAAAMTAFAAVAEETVATPAAAASVVRFKPRPAYAKYLGIAAAVVGVGLLGTVIVVSGRSRDDQAATEPAAASVTDRAMVESAPTDAPAEEAPTVGDIAASGAAPQDTTGDDAADMPVTEAPAAAEPNASETDTATTDAPADVTTSDVLSTDPSLPTDEVLVDYAEDLIARYEAGPITTPETSCTVPDAPNAVILERADLPTEVGSIDLFIAIDDTTRMVYGMDPDSCELLVDAPLP